MAGLGDLIADRFRLLSQTAKGGTATVFRAFDMRDNTSVALKLFEGSADGDQIEAEICAREAKALQKLNHPSIVKLVDFGRCVTVGQRYIAVEWIEGQTLEEYLDKKGQLTWDTFFNEIGTQVLDALCHAFEQDVSHRDISLRNALVDAHGHIKIIDFGQAKLSSIGIGLTLAGWKTPPYSPPEEDTGRYTFTRDPYSLAAIAVRACSGARIENHDELYDALAQINVEPPIRLILEKALHRDPKQRFDNILSLREAVQQGSETAPVREVALVLWIRFLPTAFKWLEDQQQENEELVAQAEAQIVDELNEAAAVRLLPEGEGRSKNRVQIETAAHRLV